MFDRLYKLVIKHTELPKGEITLMGDSSKPSLGVDFSGKILGAGATCEGQIVIRGLTEDTINRLSAIERYDLQKNAAHHNTMTLFVGWRDAVSGVESDYVKIMAGNIKQAIPGQLPERMLTVTIAEGNLNVEIPKSDDKAVSESPKSSMDEDFAAIDGIPGATPIMKYVNDFAKQWNASHDFTKVVVKGDFNDADGNPIPMVSMQYPETLSELQTFLRQTPAVTNEVVAPNKEHLGVQDHRIVIADKKEDVKTPPTEVSQDKGMIGIPTATIGGCTVKVVLKDIIPPGTFVKLTSKKFPKLSSNSDKYDKGGTYSCLSTSFHGQFHGNEWSQTLELLRPDVEIKG